MLGRIAHSDPPFRICLGFSSTITKMMISMHGASETLILSARHFTTCHNHIAASLLPKLEMVCSKRSSLNVGH